MKNKHNMQDEAPVKKQFVVKHVGRVLRVAYSADGSKIMSLARNIVYVWDARTAVCERTLYVTEGTYVFVFSSDMKVMVTLANEGARVWNVATGLCEKTLRLDTHGGGCIAMSPDNVTFAVAGGERELFICSAETGACENTLEFDESFIRCLAFSQDGSMLVSGRSDCRLMLWDVAKGTYKILRHEWNGYISGIAVSRDNGLIVSSAGGNLYVSDAVARKQIRRIWPRVGIIDRFALSPRGKEVVFVADDGTVWLWDIQRDQCLKAFKLDPRNAVSVALSPDGKTCACGFDDCNMYVFDAATLEIKEREPAKL